MKVLFLIDSLQTGGAEKSILEIAANLKIFKPVICVLFSDKEDLKEEFLKKGIEVYDLKLHRHAKTWFLKGKREFEKLLSEVVPDVVHAVLFKSEMIARISKIPPSIPLIGSFVNDSYSRERYNEQTFIRNIKLNGIRLIDKITARKVDYFTSITSTIAFSNANALNIDQRKIVAIYRGRDTTNFRGLQPESLDNEFIFITVARLLKRKGYIELIDAIVSLKSKVGQRKFICKIAGDGADGKEIRAYAELKAVNENICFLGNRTDVISLLEEAHCFIFPSHYEGQGGALIEAMLSAKPIILSDIDVFKEQVEEGQTGIFFQTKNSADLSEKMRWMINNYDLGKIMGLKARLDALKRFDILQIAAQHDSFYYKIVNDLKK